MKKSARGRLTALGIVAVLALAGCSDDGSDSGTGSEPEATATQTADAPSAEDVAALDAVTLTGEPGEEPTLEFDVPFSVSAPVARVVDEGDGAALEDGQLLSIDTVVYGGADGALANSTYGESPDQVTLGDESIYTAVTEALQGANVGARILFAVPDGADGTNLMALEVVDAQAVLERAEGEAVEPEAGLPAVTLGDDGAPTIDIPDDYEVPTELVAQTLIKGDGAEVTETSTVTVNYTGWKLSDGTVFDSSWESGSPLTISLQSVVAGWTQGLAGQTVGSQVLLIIPPDLGYGANEGHELQEETLVFVVDILAAS